MVRADDDEQLYAPLPGGIREIQVTCYDGKGAVIEERPLQKSPRFISLSRDKGKLWKDVSHTRRHLARLFHISEAREGCSLASIQVAALRSRRVEFTAVAIKPH